MGRGQGWSKGLNTPKKDVWEIKKPQALKHALIKRKIREPICEQCGWDYRKHPWFENLKPNNIPLEIHHKDGNKENNSKDNFQLLCPNCHAMTKNYRFRKRDNLAVAQLNQAPTI